ncbi:MAG TPA: nuclear transport factor 2 family protein [Sphingomicrobium sp.]
MRLFVISVGLLALAGCKDAPQNHAPVTEAEATAIAERAEASFTTGDVSAIMNQYANGAVMIDASNAAPSTDRKVQTGWSRAFVSMKPAGYHVPDRHIQIVGPDAFVSSGTEVFTVQAGAANPTVSARFTDVFQRQRDGSWKIVHEHVSMPPTPTGQP